MGDLVEITTFPREQQIFYKVPSGGLKFAVKGVNNAAIGIISNPNLKHAEISIVFGQRELTWIRPSYGTLKIANTPNIINAEEFRSFWMSWENGTVSLGRAGEDTPIVAHPEKTLRDLIYVTFFVNGGGSGPVHWKFELAPEIPRPVEKHIDGGKVEWVRSGNQVPWNAVIGGYENETLYIIRAPHSGSLAVGKFVPSRGVGYIAWGALSHEKEGPELEFLVGYDYHWVQATGSQIPVEAVVGGYTEHHMREHIFVGRARCKKHLIPGKVHRMYELCYTPFEGREVSHSNYEVLISSGINARSVNSTFRPHMTVESPHEPDMEQSESEDSDRDDMLEQDYAF